MLREGSFHTGTQTISYLAGPEGGTPLLMLHGVTTRWQTWLGVMPAFAPRWQVYALDHRGHGRSGRAADGYRILDYSADEIAFLREVVGRPAIVMGHSLGAIIAIAIAADAPELVRAVILEDPPLGAFSDQVLSERSEFARFLAVRELARGGLSAAELAAPLAALMPDIDAAALRSRAVGLSQLDPEALTFILDGRAKEGCDLAGRLKRIASPVLLLQGNLALGAALEDERATLATNLLADCTFVQMPNVGHGMHAGDPVGFCRIVTDFLETL